MIKIRLDRLGVSKKPIYRIVVVEDSQKKGGRKLEVLGFWHPAKETKNINKERLNYWLSKGAKVSQALSKLIAK
jgi:small subunit ribosomal protein S16